MHGRELLGIAAALAALCAAPAQAGAAKAPAVETMVVGQGSTLLSPAFVTPSATTVTAGGRHCRVGASTPLATLLGAGRITPLGSIRVRDFGHCSRTAARDSSALFVSAVGAERNRGRDGWVYKVGRRSGTTGAADLSGPFGTGRRLRAADRLVWFWCRMTGSSCQRTLEVKPVGATVKAGDPLAITVTGYDDAGHGRAVAGATVRLGTAVEAKTDAKGIATLTPVAPGEFAVSADRVGTVPSFPETVTVTS